MIGTEIRPLSEATFNLFRELIYEKININMRDSKHILVSNRLRKRIVALGLDNYDEYYHYLTKGEDRDRELRHFIDAVSTNETYFYREVNHFSALEETILPDLFSFKKHIRIWCAGCSSGEEPYTIAITLKEYVMKSSSSMPRIFATDLSTKVLNKAIAGIYPIKSVENLDMSLVKKYFLKGNGKSAGSIKVKKDITKMVTFERLNPESSH